LTVTRTLEGEVALTRNPAFWALWLAFFASTVGSFLLLLSLSGLLYQAESSAVLAGAVFAAQWAAPLVFSWALRWVCARPQSRVWLLVMEVAGAVTSMLVGFFVHFGWLLAVVLLLLVRGFADSTSKTLRAVLLREALPQHQIGPAGSILNTSYFVGSGVGGLAGAWIVTFADIRVLALVDGGTFLVAALCYVAVWDRLPAHTISDTAPAPSSTWVGLRALTPQLRLTVLVSVTNVAVLQGLHIVGRTALPLDVWLTGQSGVALTQLVACGALFSGAICGGYLAHAERRALTVPLALIGAAALTAATLSLIQTQRVALIVYFGFLFLFECAYGMLAGRILSLTTRGNAGPALATSEIWHTLGILAGILGLGALVDALGAQSMPALAGMALFAAIGVAVLTRLFAEERGRRRFRSRNSPA